MKYEIRELSVGGILDQAINVVKDNFGVLLAIACLLQVPLGIVAMIMASTFLGETAIDPTDPAAMQTFDPSGFFVMAGVLALLSLIVTPLTNAATIYAISDAYLGKKPSVGDSFSRALSRFGPLIWTWILFGMAVMGGLILLVIPGILCIIWFALSTQVVVLEPKSGISALGRSKELMKGNAGKWFVLILILGVIGYGINASSQMIGNMTGSGVAKQLIVTIGQIIGNLFGGAVLVILYFSARCSNENFDLELLASSFDESPESGSTTVGTTSGDSRI